MRRLFGIALIVTALAFALTPTGALALDEKSWQHIHGKVERVEGTTLTLKADDGKTITVDMNQVRDDVRKALAQGEGVTVQGRWKGDDRHAVASFIQQDSSNPARGGSVAKSVDEKNWQRIHGKVDKIEGTTLTFTADDGKKLTADVAQVHENIRKALTAGEGVTVVGHYKPDGNRMTAQFVQQDSSRGVRGGTAGQPAASPKTRQ